MSPRAASLLSLCALAACKRQPDGVDGTAIILVMDGVRLEESLGDEPSSATGEAPQDFMPHTWDELLPQGARASQAWSIGATTTTPAHVALISGRRQPLANYSVGDEVGLYRPELPSLFEAVRQQLGADEAQVRLVANTELVHPVDRSLYPGSLGASWSWVGQESDDAVPAKDDRAVLQRLQDELEADPVRLALVNLHQVDRSGHYGDEEAYLDDVRGLDGPIAELWAWLQQKADYSGDTTLVLISDHGRHSYSQDEPHWRHHGDSCNGCRRVPALVLGPGVVAGQDLWDPVLLADVAPTIAARLGVELPWADGLVLEGLFDEPTGVASRQGFADVALVDGLEAEIRYSDDPLRRSALWIEGQQLSSPDALQVEAPVLARAGEEAWLCFREITLTPDEPDTSWRPRCFHSTPTGFGWGEIDPPTARVGPMWRPVLLPEPGGSLQAMWINNVNATATGGAEGEVGEVSLALGRYDGQWQTAIDEGVQTFPTELSAVVHGAELLYAVAAAPGGSEARHERDIWVGAVGLDEEGSWSPPRAVALDAAFGGGAWRLERPALHLAPDGGLLLAAVGHSESGGHAVLAVSEDSGQSFEPVGPLELPGAVAPQVTPVWLGDRAVWVSVDEGSGASSLCAVGVHLELACTSTGSPRVLRLLVDGDALYALVDAGIGQWELERFAL